MIKAIIIDDESKSRDLLELLIHESEKEVQVVAKCADLLSGVEQIKIQNPDVVFLDIEMPEISGLQILDYIPNPDFEIIFATAYSQYAIKAFELSALDYLLKPIDDNMLAASIDKLGQKIDIKSRLEAYEENIKQKSPTKICIPSSSSHHDMVQIEDILAIEADRNYCIIHTIHKKYTLSKSLSVFSEKYLPIEGFTRTHRSWVVNLSHLQRFDIKNKELVLPQITIPISRGNFAKVKTMIESIS